MCFFTGVAVHVQSCCTYTASMTLQDYIAEIAGGGGGGSDDLIDWQVDDNNF